MDIKKIGVLLPQSKEHPNLPKAFLNGLRLSLPETAYQLVIEGIGFGNEQKTIINAIQKLVYQEAVTLTTGLMGHHQLDEILNWVEGMDETLIYADLGATRPLDLSGRQNIYCNSLDLYRATHMLGKYFLNQGWGAIGTSTCYYESGYGFLEAMETALHEHQEGAFSGHFITPLHPRANESELMTDFLTTTQPDALFAFHNGTFAKEHASYLTKNQIHKKIPIYTLPFSIADKILEAFPKIFQGTQCVSSWFPDLDLKANQDFVHTYQKKYDKKPSVFAMLGFENGLIIQHYLHQKNEADLPKTQGPRGEISYNHKAHRTFPKQYLWEVQWHQESYKIQCIQELDRDISMNFTDHPQKNGWNNAYLCH